MPHTLNQIIYVDPKRCLGCHSCELACAMAHSTARNIFEAVDLEGLVSRTDVVAVGGTSVPMQCRHCENAPCSKVCPTGAIRQFADRGTVDIDEQTCVGCKLCTMVCPFGVISVLPRSQSGDTSGVAVKCDLCAAWRERTGKSNTACEESCATQAIRLVDLDLFRAAQANAKAQQLAAAHRNLQFAFEGGTP